MLPCVICGFPALYAGFGDDVRHVRTRLGIVRGAVFGKQSRGRDDFVNEKLKHAIILYFREERVPTWWVAGIEQKCDLHPRHIHDYAYLPYVSPRYNVCVH